MHGHAPTSSPAYTHTGSLVVVSPILGFLVDYWQYLKSIHVNKLPFRRPFKEAFIFAVFIKFNGLFMALPIIIHR